MTQTVQTRKTINEVNIYKKNYVLKMLMSRVQLEET